MDDRDEIARQYGFQSFTELLAISERLAKLPGDATQSYIARQANGKWFIWDDSPPTAPATEQP